MRYFCNSTKAQLRLPRMEKRIRRRENKTGNKLQHVTTGRER